MLTDRLIPRLVRNTVFGKTRDDIKKIHPCEFKSDFLTKVLENKFYHSINRHTFSYSTFLFCRSMIIS